MRLRCIKTHTRTNQDVCSTFPESQGEVHASPQNASNNPNTSDTRRDATEPFNTITTIIIVRFFSFVCSSDRPRRRIVHRYLFTASLLNSSHSAFGFSNFRPFRVHRTAGASARSWDAGRSSISNKLSKKSHAGPTQPRMGVSPLGCCMRWPSLSARSLLLLPVPRASYHPDTVQPKPPRAGRVKCEMQM